MTHQSFMQDPMTAQMIGQNPQANQMMAALQAHIAEHYAFLYRNQIEQQVGAPLLTTGEDEPLPEDMENALSRMVAQAAQQLTQKHMAEAQQQQAQQQAQDPILQMQMKELSIKEAEVQRKMQKDQAELQLRLQQQQIEQERIASQERQATAAMQSREEIEGLKMGVEIAKSAEAMGAKGTT